MIRRRGGVTELQLGNITYTQEQSLSILHEPVRGNGILILAKQDYRKELFEWAPRLPMSKLLVPARLFAILT